MPSSSSGFQPTCAGAGPSPPPGFQPFISDVVPFTVSSFLLVFVDVVASSVCGFRPASAHAASVVSQALDPTAQREIQPLEPFNDLHSMYMSIFLEICLMDGKDSVPPEDPPPRPLLTNEFLDSSAVEYLDASVAEAMDPLVAQPRARTPREKAGHNALHATAVVAPRPAAFAVRKPSTKISIYFFHTSTDHANEFLMKETANKQGVRLTGAFSAVRWVLGG